MSSIADAAGLSRATVYRHFPSRESLEEAIRAEALTAARAVLSQLDTERPATAAIEQAVGGLVRLGPRFGVLLRDGSSPGEDFLRQRDEVLRPLQQIVRRAREDGELDPDVNEMWAFQALTALLMAAARASATAGGSPDAAADAVCRTYFRGLGSGAGAATQATGSAASDSAADRS